MKKIALYHHWDKHDIVDDFVLYVLKALLDYGFEIIFTTNSKLNDEQKKRLDGLASQIIFRSNKGFDFGAWKEVLLGNRKKFQECDQLLLLNNSCFGPIFPLQESFEKMAALDADYWGLTSCEQHPEVPDHLHSYFVCFTPRVIKSDAFWNFWEKVWDYTDFWEAVYEGERRLTKELKQAGFKYRTVVEMKDFRQSFSTGYKEAFSLYAADYLIMKYRMPFVKIKAFAHDSYNPYDAGGVVLKALDAVNSDYPREYIYNYLNRAMTLSWQKNLPERTQVFQRELTEKLPECKLKLAVITHVFYVDVLNEFIDYLRNIPVHCDFLITTTTEKDKKAIEERLNKENLNAKVLIRVVKNHGRDVYPWLTAFKDIQDQYDLCLKIHAKKSAYQAEAFGFIWHHFLMESLLATPDYVRQILHRFETDPALGIMFPVCPPIVKLMSKHAIYEDTDLKEEWLKMLQIPLKGHEDMSVFPVGTMFWYRPAAMKKLLHSSIKPEIFPGEPFPVSHSMAHGLERALPYVAQDAGYTFNYVIPVNQLVSAFHIYEDRLSSLMQISACGFELFFTAPGECFSAEKTTSALVETWNRTFAFSVGDINVSSNDRLWRLDFGNPGDVIKLQDIRYLDKEHDCIFSLKENPESFHGVGCVMEKEEDGGYFYAPLGNDPQIHVEFPGSTDPSQIRFIAVDMYYEDNQAYAGDAFRYREELTRTNQLILDQQEVICRRDEELKQRGALISDQQEVIKCRDEELKLRGALISDQQAIIDQRNEELQQRGRLIADQQSVISAQNGELAEKSAALQQQSELLAQKYAAIAVLEAELNAMRNSKVWRWSAPARKVVGKIRRSIKK